MHLRAVMEDMLSQHFGHEFIDEFFDRYPSKLDKLSINNTRFDHLEKNDRNVFFLAKLYDLQVLSVIKSSCIYF